MGEHRVDLSLRGELMRAIARHQRKRRGLRIAAGPVLLLAGGLAGIGVYVLGASAGSSYPATPTATTIAQLQTVAANLGDGNLSSSSTPPTGAEVVLTTRATALMTMSGDTSSQEAGSPVYVVQVRGSFVGYSTKTPTLDSGFPSGSSLWFIFDPSSGEMTDWGINTNPVDLSSMGSVSQFPVSLSPSSHPSG